MPLHAALQKPGEKFAPYAREFFDDTLAMFLGLGRGEISKYMYNGGEAGAEAALWGEILNAKSDFYVPRVEKELIEMAHAEISRFLPRHIPYVDFGVGGLESVKRYALPIMQLLDITEYHGVDFDGVTLEKLWLSDAISASIRVHAHQVDFFRTDGSPVVTTPALGVMNGITITNMYGSLQETAIHLNLQNILCNLSKMSGHGWLLLSIDTNYDEASLLKMYDTPLNRRLNMNSLRRVNTELPVTGFDPSLFTYETEWRPKQHLLAHLARCTEKQDFLLGDRHILLEKGNKLHLFNSYRFPKEFFENCCLAADLTPVRCWQNDSTVLLYLLHKP